MSKAVFDKFSSVTVEAIQGERDKVAKLEKVTNSMLKKHKSSCKRNL